MKTVVRYSSLRREIFNEKTLVNMSAYVALSCLIAFIVVITICLLKQFIWDPLLSKRFEVLRPVISESVRKLSTSFHRPQSTSTSTFSIHKSASDVAVHTNEQILLPSKNFIAIPQNLPSTDNPTQKTLPRRSYGSSSLNNSFAYTNYGSDDLSDERIHPCPILHFSCEYNPSTFSIRLNIQNLRNMNSLMVPFHHLLTRSASIFLRFLLSTTIAGEPYETSFQHYQDFIRFGETFNILSNIKSGDILNYQLRFTLMLKNDQNTYELGELIYTLKDEQLTHILYVERILPIRLEKKSKSITTEENN